MSEKENVFLDVMLIKRGSKTFEKTLLNTETFCDIANGSKKILEQGGIPIFNLDLSVTTADGEHTVRKVEVDDIWVKIA